MTKIPTTFSIEIDTLGIIKTKIKGKEKISSYLNRLISDDLKQNNLIPDTATIVEDCKYQARNNFKRAYKSEKRMNLIDKVRKFMLHHIVFKNLDDSSEFRSRQMADTKLWLTEYREIANILECCDDDKNEIDTYIELTKNEDQLGIIEMVFERHGNDKIICWMTKKFGEKYMISKIMQYRNK